MGMLIYRFKLLKKIGISYLFALVNYGIIIKLTNLLTFNKFKKYYGNFYFKKSYNKYLINNVNNYSGCIVGPITYFLNTIKDKNKKILLLEGEDNKVKNIFKDNFNFGKIITTGLSDYSDFIWDFEQDIPKNRRKIANVIVSQSILEHLINPYKHVTDLIKLLKPNGILIFQTVLPGFGYHRVSIDCFRIYPDWFEEIAKRHNLRIINKSIYNSQICYMYKKN